MPREGFSRTELGATMGGEPPYRPCGYPQIERMNPYARRCDRAHHADEKTALKKKGRL
jgi:hypothetical protein